METAVPRNEALNVWKFDHAIGPLCKLLIVGDLGIGSSGWTRTSNPPVNSCGGLFLHQLVRSESAS